MTDYKNAQDPEYVLNQSATWNAQDRELLTRLDERTSHIERGLHHLTTERLDTRYVRKDEFRNIIGPIEKLTYGAAGAVLLAFVGAVVAVVLKQ